MDTPAPVRDKPRSGYMADGAYWSCEECGWVGALTSRGRVRRHRIDGNDPDKSVCSGSHVQVDPPAAR